MKRYCTRCETRLRLTQIKCLYCRERAVNWLHVTAITAFAVTAVVFLLKFF
jgi:hypothetical protein